MNRSSTADTLTRCLFPLYCKRAIFISYIQWLIFLQIGNTMKNTMLRNSFKMLEKIAD